MVDAWLAPDHQYFKVRGDNGACYILRNDVMTARWELTMFDRTGAGKPVGNIYYGACSWTDRTLIESDTFYPETAKTAADRLSFYADAFPIVEVDATYYALPSERNAQLWVARTPPGFLFNIKAFGLFTHHPVPVERLPEAVKELLPRL